MSLDGDIALLSRIPLFTQLATDHLRLLAFGAGRLELAAGTVLFEKGQKAGSGLIVVSGRIDLVEGEARTVIRSCEPGTLLGELALFIDTTRPATAVAAIDSEAIELSRTLVTRMLREYPHVAVRLRASLAQRLQGTMGELTRVQTALLDAGGKDGGAP